MDNVRVQLTNNRGFKWFESDGIHFKGYLLEEGRYISGQEAIDLIRLRLQDLAGLKDKLLEFNGIFAFILNRKDETVVCTDRIRSFPVFYSQKDGIIHISDDPRLLKCSKSQVSEKAVNIFLHTGYTIGESTLFADIFQVQAGEYISFTEKVIKKEFYHFYESDKISDNETVLENELESIINQIGDDLAESLKSKTPVVPLSSGYDSRLIAALLKKRSFENVITFTYGRKNNPELELSKKSSEKLGFKWRYIEYSNDTVRHFIKSDEFNSYYPNSSNYSSMFYLQEYFALKELKKDLPQNSIFIPGHSGDFFAGSHLSNRIITSETENEIIDEIIKKHYSNKQIGSDNKGDIIVSIKKSLRQKSKYNYLDFENWDIKERQAKFILNSNRIYEHFGYGFRLPLMDNRLMDFFAKVSPDLKYGKKLYAKVLKERFFENLGLNFENETNPSIRVIELQDKKNTLKQIIPKKIINFYKEKMKKNYDIYYNIGVTDEMIADLLSSGVEIDKTGENRNSIIIQWYINQVKSNKI